MFKNRSLAVKMSVGFGVPLLMIGIITVVVFTSANSVQRNAVLAKEESAVFARVAQDMKTDVIQIQQYLQDISATRGMDGLDDGLTLAEERYQSLLAGIAKFRTMYQEENDVAGLEILKSLESAAAAYYDAGKKLAQGYIEGGPEVGNKMMADFDAKATQMDGQLAPFVESQNQELAAAMDSIVTSTNTLSTVVLLVGLSALAIGIAFSWVLIRSITKSINRIVDGLRAGAAETASASTQVSQSSQSMASGASEQASSLEETSASLEQMTAMTKQNANNASEAKNLAAMANVSAEKGSESMRKMGVAIDEIKRSADETAKILRTIDEIAFQTNLLALNAAVEAARAGDAGKGFAVVAEEVRNLARRSAEAAKSTATMIEGSVKNADNGVQIRHEVGASLTEIGESIRKVNGLVGEIAAASNEQAQGIEQINIAVSQMDKVTQQNAASSEEAAAAAEELNAQAEEMKRMVDDLRALVAGAGTNGPSSNGGAHPSPAAPLRRPSLTHAQAKTVKPAERRAPLKLARPEQVIPLDNDDMNDF